MWLGLIKLGLATAVVAGACGLTASACDLTSHGVPPAYERVEIPEAGLALDVPISWLQLAQEPAWSPAGNGRERIAISWFHLVSNIVPATVLLPDGCLSVASTPIALDWGGGRQYLVKCHGGSGTGPDATTPTLSVEIHTILALADGETQWAYDLHAVAPTEAELVALKPVLDTMLGSMRLTPHLLTRLQRQKVDLALAGFHSEVYSGASGIG